MKKLLSQLLDWYLEGCEMVWEMREASGLNQGLDEYLAVIDWGLPSQWSMPGMTLPESWQAAGDHKES